MHYWENEENSANRQMQDNLITLTSVSSCIDFTSLDSSNQVFVYLPEFWKVIALWAFWLQAFSLVPSATDLSQRKKCLCASLSLV